MCKVGGDKNNKEYSLEYKSMRNEYLKPRHYQNDLIIYHMVLCWWTTMNYFCALTEDSYWAVLITFFWQGDGG